MTFGNGLENAKKYQYNVIERNAAHFGSRAVMTKYFIIFTKGSIILWQRQLSQQP